MTPHFPIYMDYGATTPCDPRVVDAMIPWLREHFGNPASRSHAWAGRPRRRSKMRASRSHSLVNADPREIVWTSGATESINLALKGAAHFYGSRGKHLITLKTEHKAVLDTMRELERQGFRGDLPRRAGKRPARPGQVQGRAAQGHHPGVGAVGQHEIGVIQDIPAIGALCRERGIIFHVDAAQGHGQGHHRPERAAGRPDEPGLAQDLWPQGHWRAVCAAQAARAN